MFQLQLLLYDLLNDYTIPEQACVHELEAKEGDELSQSSQKRTRELAASFLVVSNNAVVPFSNHYYLSNTMSSHISSAKCMQSL